MEGHWPEGGQACKGQLQGYPLFLRPNSKKTRHANNMPRSILVVGSDQ